MGLNYVGIICVCVVFFMTIEATRVVPGTAPMDHISGTFLLYHCYLLFIFKFAYNNKEYDNSA